MPLLVCKRLTSLPEQLNEHIFSRKLLAKRDQRLDTGLKLPGSKFRSGIISRRKNLLLVGVVA